MGSPFQFPLNLLFDSWIFQISEEWAPDTSFYAPRYIFSLPNGKLVVLDNKALYLFTPTGRLICKMFEGEAKRFRGLAFYKEFGRLITTETTDDVVNLVFIDVEHTRDIVDV